MTPDSPPLEPISSGRVALLDVLRGFALYGVLLANTVVWFTGLGFMSRAERAAITTRYDEIAGAALGFLVHGKAMTLFTFLFGLGFAVQLDRATARGQSGVPVYLRRVAALFAIGIAHIVLLWWGDILCLYALTALLMVLLRGLRPRSLVIVAILLLVAQIVVSLPPAKGWLVEAVTPDEKTAFRARMLAAMMGHDRWLLVRMQVAQALHHVRHIPLAYVPWMLGRFLLGYAAGRSRLLHTAAERQPLFRRALAGGLVLAVASNVVTFYLEKIDAAGGGLRPPAMAGLLLVGEVAVLATVTAYVSAVALLMSRPLASRVLLQVAPAGQMALTNYLGQSLACTFFFYGWGLGFMGHVGIALCVPLTLAFFALQVVGSRLWLKRFRFGPMEWLWRSLAYGRAQPMRRAPAS
ncbi:MAG: hypothetical protein JWP97_6307 [Labilithrix sp.]|nr:hypothetical protein [Labilithrix sp.]